MFGTAAAATTTAASPTSTADYSCSCSRSHCCCCCFFGFASQRRKFTLSIRRDQIFDLAAPHQVGDRSCAFATITSANYYSGRTTNTTTSTNTAPTPLTTATSAATRTACIRDSRFFRGVPLPDGRTPVEQTCFHNLSQEVGTSWGLFPPQIRRYIFSTSTHVLCEQVPHSWYAWMFVCACNAM